MCELLSLLLMLLLCCCCCCCCSHCLYCNLTTTYFQILVTHLTHPPFTHSLTHSLIACSYAQKSLVMKCLGPPESRWNQQVFEVTQGGCIGGRRVPTLPPASDSSDSGSGGAPRRDRESVLFDDSTVSRVHFEVAHDPVGQHYTIRDLVRHCTALHSVHHSTP
jgi:hypothetical protein